MSSRRPAPCQVAGCQEDMSTQPRYCRRHRVCQAHLRCLSLDIGGASYRFCQQCAKFHVVSAFDGNKRSCRASLIRHKQRRVQSKMPVAPVEPAGDAGADSDDEDDGSSKSSGKHSSSDSVDDPEEEDAAGGSNNANNPQDAQDLLLSHLDRPSSATPSLVPAANTLKASAATTQVVGAPSQQLHSHPLPIFSALLRASKPESHPLRSLLPSSASPTSSSVHTTSKSDSDAPLQLRPPLNAQTQREPSRQSLDGISPSFVRHSNRRPSLTLSSTPKAIEEASTMAQLEVSVIGSSHRRHSLTLERPGDMPQGDVSMQTSQHVSEMALDSASPRAMEVEPEAKKRKQAVAYPQTSPAAKAAAASRSVRTKKPPGKQWSFRSAEASTTGRDNSPSMSVSGSVIRQARSDSPLDRAYSAGMSSDTHSAMRAGRDESPRYRRLPARSSSLNSQSLTARLHNLMESQKESNATAATTRVSPSVSLALPTIEVPVPVASMALHKSDEIQPQNITSAIVAETGSQVVSVARPVSQALLALSQPLLSSGHSFLGSEAVQGHQQPEDMTDKAQRAERAELGGTVLSDRREEHTPQGPFHVQQPATLQSLLTQLQGIRPQQPAGEAFTTGPRGSLDEGNAWLGVTSQRATGAATMSSALSPKPLSRLCPARAPYSNYTQSSLSLPAQNEPKEQAWSSAAPWTTAPVLLSPKLLSNPRPPFTSPPHGRPRPLTPGSFSRNPHLDSTSGVPSEMQPSRMASKVSPPVSEPFSRAHAPGWAGTPPTASIPFTVPELALTHSPPAGGSRTYFRTQSDPLPSGFQAVHNSSMAEQLEWARPHPPSKTDDLRTQQQAEVTSSPTKVTRTSGTVPEQHADAPSRIARLTQQAAQYDIPGASQVYRGLFADTEQLCTRLSRLMPGLEQEASEANMPQSYSHLAQLRMPSVSQPWGSVSQTWQSPYGELSSLHSLGGVLGMGLSPDSNRERSHQAEPLDFGGHGPSSTNRSAVHDSSSLDMELEAVLAELPSLDMSQHLTEIEEEPAEQAAYEQASAHPSWGPSDAQHTEQQPYQDHTMRTASTGANPESSNGGHPYEWATVPASLGLPPRHDSTPLLQSGFYTGTSNFPSQRRNSSFTITPDTTGLENFEEWPATGRSPPSADQLQPVLQIARQYGSQTQTVFSVPRQYGGRPDPTMSMDQQYTNRQADGGMSTAQQDGGLPGPGMSSGQRYGERPGPVASVGEPFGAQSAGLGTATDPRYTAHPQVVLSTQQLGYGMNPHAGIPSSWGPSSHPTAGNNQDTAGAWNEPFHPMHSQSSTGSDGLQTLTGSMQLHPHASSLGFDGLQFMRGSIQLQSESQPQAQPHSDTQPQSQSQSQACEPSLEHAASSSRPNLNPSNLTAAHPSLENIVRANISRWLMEKRLKLQQPLGATSSISPPVEPEAATTHTTIITTDEPMHASDAPSNSTPSTQHHPPSASASASQQLLEMQPDSAAAGKNPAAPTINMFSPAKSPFSLASENSGWGLWSGQMPPGASGPMHAVHVGVENTLSGDRDFQGHDRSMPVAQSDSAYPSHSDSAYPLHSDSGYPPRSDSAYAPHSDSAYPPRSDSAYAPLSDSAYAPRSDSANPSRSDSAYAPRGDSAYPPRSDSAYAPHSDSAYPQPSGPYDAAPVHTSDPQSTYDASLLRSHASGVQDRFHGSHIESHDLGHGISPDGSMLGVQAANSMMPQHDVLEQVLKIMQGDGQQVGNPRSSQLDVRSPLGMNPAMQASTAGMRQSSGRMTNMPGSHVDAESDARD